MNNHFFILDIEDGNEAVTLDDLAARVQQAVNAGLPGHAVIKSGWSATLLRDCLYFEAEPREDLMSLEELRSRTTGRSGETAQRAWQEVERRLRKAEEERDAARLAVQPPVEVEEERDAAQPAVHPPVEVDENGWTEADHLAAEGKA